MAIAPFSLQEDYWETFILQEEDTEFLYNYLLELETPLTSREMVSALVTERIKREIKVIERQRTAAGDIYLPKESHTVNQKLVFPAFGWQQGQIVDVREGHNPDLPPFKIIRVDFESGEQHEFASELPDHILNDPPSINQEDELLDSQSVLLAYGDELSSRLEEGLNDHTDFVRIAGKWFPRALLIDINVGQLNLAEAVLDIAGGGPLSTSAILNQVDIPSSANPKLVEFSFDLALQEDMRFDEVGPAGETLWYLNRLEPEEVREVPSVLRYHEIDHDRSSLTDDMIMLERELDDELSPINGKSYRENATLIRLIFPHWRVGSLPLSSRIDHLFPTAYEAPRIRFTWIDEDSGEQFPGWVAREKKYVIGLEKWYQKRGLIPGSLVRVKRGKNPGEVMVSADSRRASREWIRTVLVGSDGGIVFAMLKQVVSAAYDDRMAIAIPDPNAIDQVWVRMQKERPPFEKVVVTIVRELTKLNPQGHVHASELYAAINVVRRVPPAPILALLGSRSWFIHVGDLHFRLDDSERN